MVIETVATSVAIANGATGSIERGAKGFTAAVRKMRLAGIVEINWLDLPQLGMELTATQVADVEQFLASERVRPLLAMTTFAVFDSDLRSSLEENFKSEAKRWQIEHKAGWHEQAASLYSRIAAVYTGAVGEALTNTHEAVVELNAYSQFISGSLYDALHRGLKSHEFASRLVTLSSDFERMLSIDGAVAFLSEQIAASAKAQPISSLSQSDHFADFASLYVQRTFEEIESGSSVPGQVFSLSGFPFRAVLLGSPGAGKTTFVKHLVATSVDDSAVEVKIPIIEIRCRDYFRAGWGSGLVEYMLNVLSTSLSVGWSSTQLEDLLLLGRVAVVFDGLDEVTSQVQRSELVQRIQAFSRRFPALSVLVTSREIGYSRAPLDSVRFSEVRLSEFSDDQIAQYTAKWFALSGRPDLEESFLEDSETIRDIRRNPLLLSLLCMLYREHGAIPLNRRAIYANCANELFHRWDTHRQIAQVESMPKYGDRLMQEIARWFYRSPSTSGGLDEKVLTKVISNFMRDSLGFDEGGAERSAADFLEFCAGRAWLLARVGTTSSGVRIFNFTHRTFYEYFAADSMARSEKDAGTMAGLIEMAHRNDVTSVLPELLIQAFDEYNERGAADVYVALCARSAPIPLLLRLMEGTILPAFTRKRAFDLVLRQYASSGGLGLESCTALFSVTSAARRQFLDSYILNPEMPTARVMFIDLWASHQLTGRWSSRAVASWQSAVDEVLARFAEREHDEWSSAAVVNWRLVRGLEAPALVTSWQLLVCPTSLGWAPGAAWWALDNLFARRGSISAGSPLRKTLTVLWEMVQVRGAIPRVMLERLHQCLQNLSVEQLRWDLQIPPSDVMRHRARSLLVIIALAMHEAGLSNGLSLVALLAQQPWGVVDEIVLENELRRRGLRRPLSINVQECLIDLPDCCGLWALDDWEFVYE